MSVEMVVNRTTNFWYSWEVVAFISGVTKKSLYAFEEFYILIASRCELFAGIFFQYFY